MNKYKRISSSPSVPRHRFSKFIHYLSSEVPKSMEDYIETIKFEKERSQGKQWTSEDRAEAIEALNWLIKNDLVKVSE
jgi:hypothetical protein